MIQKKGQPAFRLIDLFFVIFTSSSAVLYDAGPIFELQGVETLTVVPPPPPIVGRAKLGPAKAV